MDDDDSIGKEDPDYESYTGIFEFINENMEYYYLLMGGGLGDFILGKYDGSGKNGT